ncbi:nucleotide exchange factor GrpE [Planctellipticum variicoloris]|uniref:nucleotide exchange factor GrpE n=1 Tax=Planctellipticum variicoloris TaxID=3064265 RepID=UPI002BE3D356|nr:nucleotide exchange factor GrpE [Planctomycetaceae bacterium SH412]HTN04268.1 nucleotide exchange factor GrpE [Planctomycetaceae bacterium]
MNDSMFQRESSGEPPCGETPSRDEAPPQFGAVDIVEAFTAMRHEWRGQTKESRALAEQIQAAVTNLQSLESKLLVRAADSRPDDSAAARQLALLIVETDHQLSRAVAAIAQWERNRRLREEADANAVDLYFAGMNGVARWFARPLLTFVVEQRRVQSPAAENPAIEGLNLVLTRLRRAMNDRDIDRLDTEGSEFDANTMRAIGAVESVDCPSGHVVEQLAPAYRWQGRLLRFADVRVAK